MADFAVAARTILEALEANPMIMWKVCRGLNEREFIGPWEPMSNGHLRVDASGDSVAEIEGSEEAILWIVYDNEGNTTAKGSEANKFEAMVAADRALQQTYPSAEVIGILPNLRES